jgi:hypothetical protein
VTLEGPDSGAEPDAGAAAEFSIVAGNPTPEELAAVTAVLAAMVEELEDGARREGAPPVSAWQRSQRAIRRPLNPGAGAWRSFSGT